MNPDYETPTKTLREAMEGFGEPNREIVEAVEKAQGERKKRSMTKREVARLNEIRKHARSKLNGRKKDPKWGTWLEIDETEINAAERDTGNTRKRPDQVFMNNLYMVHVFSLPDAGGEEMALLMVRRHDTKPIPRHWAVMNKIKEDLVGDQLALEVYPTQAQLMDSANMYHLWVFLNDMEIPFGLHLKGFCVPKPEREATETEVEAARLIGQARNLLKDHPDAEEWRELAKAWPTAPDPEDWDKQVAGE